MSTENTLRAALALLAEARDLIDTMPSYPRGAELCDRIDAFEASAPAPAPAPAAHPVAWLNMADAPLDNTLVRLLVKFDNHGIEDTDEPTATIGAHNDGEWNFVGWCWHRDEWTRGSGDLLGWLPMAPAAHPATAQAEPATAQQTAPAGYCSQGDLCNCGGDTPAVRAGCRNWRAAPAGQAAAPEPLPYATPMELWQAFKRGSRFVLHYHGKTYPVERMSPREHVVYVQPPGLPVKIYPNGSNCESAGSKIWLEEVKQASAAEAAQPVQAPSVPPITDAMVDAYRRANDAYWKRCDESIQQPIGKWRAGTPRDATRVSLQAALAARPTQPTPTTPKE